MKGAMNQEGSALPPRLRTAIERECSRRGPEGVVRVETAIPRTDALTWLRAQSGHPSRVYWASRSGEEER